MPPAYIQRRALLLSMATGVLTGPALGQAVEDDHLLKPGQFTWHPERSPEGPVAVIVSIPDQLTHVYRNGIRIGVSTCSTGRPGHATPTGVFTILQKQVDHHSNIYGGAEMADMERLTWTGIALHVGGLPGYPSSHGCVHLPRAFSDRLYAITRVGTVVIIADAASAPEEIVHPGLLLSPAAEREIDGELQAKAQQKLPMAGAATPAGPLAMLVSSADQRFVIQLGGDTVASGAVTIADPATPLGEHVLVLAGAGPDGARWQAFRYGQEAGGSPEPRPEQIMARLQVDGAGQAAIARHLHQGALLITTDLPLTPDRQSGSDLVVISS
ncbi:L,D-transpeptidase [Geminicoccus flavidas]|uniref:L,D-transpeptidase n=1 Tax=Geminicoccus flavidas TaxID=2506407 RepID=UPI00190F347C|nr:L,D-transpeptidase [Geminicoccus flavidas]